MARSDSTAIVDAIVSLARALHLMTIGEGIETPQHLQRLRSIGCELGQGYLFGAAQPADAFGPDPRAAVRRAIRSPRESSRDRQISAS